MPIIKNAKTVWVGDDAFNIPGTNLTIYSIKLEVDGETVLHKTMSEKIANQGWEGDIEIYTNDKGKEYVRQAPKENDFKGGKASFAPKDEKSITLGLVFKTFCTVEGMLPTKPEHWGYIKAATIKLIEIGNQLKEVKEVKEQPKQESGYEKARQVAQSMKKPPVDEWGNADDAIDLSEIPF